MQLLGSFSEEGQSTVPLLGLIDSPVQKMDANGLPVPHSGWNQVKALAGNPCLGISLIMPISICTQLFDAYFQQYHRANSIWQSV